MCLSVAVYGSVSAVKCYVCDSSLPSCSENVFTSFGIPTDVGCTCCKVSVVVILTGFLTDSE